MSPYLCLLYNGLFSTAFIIIGGIIYSLFLNGDLSFIIDTFDFSNIEDKSHLYIYIVISFILFSFSQVLVYLIIFYFSPTLYVITEVISSILGWIVNAIKIKYLFFEIILECIGSLFLLFGILVYNEIIICNFWGLNYNTKKFIEQRQNIENNLLNNNEDNDDEDNINNENSEDGEEDDEQEN